MITEKEVKILLNEQQYNKLILLFEWDKEYLQKNYYYDDPMKWNSDGDKTYRIREKQGKRYLQVKILELKSNSLHFKREYEKEIKEIPDSISKQDLKELAGYEGNNDLVLIGDLSTLRKECNSFDDVVICLDKNYYLGVVDYELEVEFIREYPFKVINLLSEAGIIANKDTHGKYCRFKKRYLCSDRRTETNTI